MWSARLPPVSRMMLGVSSLLAASSCLYDGRDRCDADQVYDSVAGLCVCNAKLNYVAGALGCVSCGANEVAENDSCSCVDGFRRAMPGAACEAEPEALGAACEKDADCVDATYGTCHLVGGGAGYCTSSGCTQNSDCAAGYGCDTRVSPSYCERPPDGVGKSCASDKDCAGTQATFCEYFQTKVCFVEGCTVGGNDCFPGQECCDLTAQSLGLFKRQICVDSGSCKK